MSLGLQNALNRKEQDTGAWYQVQALPSDRPGRVLAQTAH